MKLAPLKKLIQTGIIFFTLAISLCLTFPVLAAGTAVVSVSSPAQPVSPGSQFTISITVQPNNAIAGVQFNLSFNPSMIMVNNVTEGNQLKQNGASSYFIPGQIDNTAGTISGVSGVIISPGQTISNSGTFALITATALTTRGNCSLDLSNVIVGDINGVALTLNSVNGQVIIDSPPILNSIGNKTVNEGSLLSFTISATDPDGDSLTYSASNLPSGASFNASTRTFSWTPGFTQAGSYTSVHFQVSDGSLTDSEDITFTVVKLFEDWDTNGDGAVNVLDIIVVGQHWGESGKAGWIQADVNSDGIINVLDNIIIGQHWTG
jgi:adhesin HecA-like repeat protein